MSPTQPPDGSRVERKKEETRHKIITTAMNLFRQNGFDATTMEHIAAEVDIAKGTLYNYFPVKEAIIDEYIKRTSRERNSERLLSMQKLPDTRSRMALVFSELIQGVQTQKLIFEKYVMYRMQSWVSFHQDESEKSGFNLVAAEIVRLGQKDGEIRSDMPFDMLLDIVEYVFMLVVKQFYLEPENFNAAEMIEHCADLCLNGIKKH